MLNVTGDFRTVEFYDYREEQKVDPVSNQPYTSRQAWVIMATSRPFMQPVIENGQQVVEPDGKGGTRVKKAYKSDFFLVKFTGNDAQVIKQYCDNKDANGKIISRHLYISGYALTYQKDKEIDIDKIITINNQNYEVKFKEKFNTTNTIINVEHFKFLDKKPGEQMSVQPIGTPMVQAVAAPAQVYQQPTAQAGVVYQQPASAPVHQQAPVAASAVAPAAAPAVAPAPVQQAGTVVVQPGQPAVVTGGAPF